MKTPTFLGKVKDGRITWDKPDLLRLWEASLPDGYVVGTIKPKKGTRSDRQRAYYWAVVVPAIAVAKGIGKEEANEMLKWMFNAIELEIDGVPQRVGMSIEAETTDRVEEINTNIRNWGATVGVYIPLPNESDWLKVY